MKKLVIILMVFAYIKSFAQQHNEPCGFNIFTNTKAKSVQDFEMQIAKELATSHLSNHSSHTTGIFIIPLVIHIIHNGGIENISDSQIFSQIQILNEDFRKLTGTNGDGNGVDTKIQFCLAKINPDGKCTNGIVRIKSILTNHQTYQRSLLKDLSFWDPTKFLNIYVVNSINNGILGYSSFPSGPPEGDGVVIRDDAFGNTGTVSSSSNLGRTLTHEIAHWFGLYHTFQDGCGIDTCTDGDKVCDTPPVANPNYGCPVSVNSCHNDKPDVNDQVANYADYSNDACKSIFTAGQRDRMQATLTAVRINIWSYANLISTGCDTAYIPPSNCAVIADFTVAKTDLCVGSSIGFTNRSLHNPTNFLWIFTGGTPSLSLIENPTVNYPTSGFYSVKLKVWNTLTQDSSTKINYISVTTPSPGAELGINEGFENSVFPWSGISVENPDTGITWQRTKLAAYQGGASVRINNLINLNYGQNDALILPDYNFTTFHSIPYLRFKWAYARSDDNYSDELIVLVSKDCGLNWQQLFYRTGNTLVTGSTLTSEYIPDSTTIWKTANINLNAYALQTNVKIKIVNVTDGGNCLYIDNINMGDTNLIWSGIKELPNEKDLSVYPNPATNGFTINSEVNLSGCTINIYNNQGKLCQQHVLTSENQNQIQFNQNVSTGLYFVEINKGTDQFHIKFIKQ